MWTLNFQTFKLVLEKAEEPEIKLPTSTGSLKNQESSKNKKTKKNQTSISPLLSMSKFDSGDNHKLWKILKEMEIQDHLTASWETCMQVKMQQLELDMEQ